jgi:hypothetical protein
MARATALVAIVARNTARPRGLRADRMGTRSFPDA